MKLRNKKTGQLGKFIINKDHFECVDLDYVPEYRNLAELNAEWEDAPEEPKEYWCVLPNRVRRVILSWVKTQDNPIVKISILLRSHFDTNKVDSDGFYDYEFYGYVNDNNKNLVANTLSIRLKKPFAFDEDRDYTLPELGIMVESGGEE